MRKSHFVWVPFCAAVVVPVACSSNPPQPVAPTFELDAGFGVGPAVGAYDAAAPDPNAAQDAGALDASGVFGYLSDAGTAPAAPAPGADDAALDALLAQAAAKHAPKMQPEGTIGRATLAPNEHFDMIVSMAPNRCYTIIGVSQPNGVTQLDLKLLAPPFYTVMAGASNPADKNTPVIGKGTQALCPIAPIAVPYKIDAVATKGAGRIAVQVYARDK